MDGVVLPLKEYRGAATARQPPPAIRQCARSGRRADRIGRRTALPRRSTTTTPTLSDRRPPPMWSMFAACLARSAGSWKSAAPRPSARASRCHRRQRRGRGPRIERRRVHALDVVEIQLRDQREVVAPLLAPSAPGSSRNPTSAPLSSSTLRSHPPKTGSQYPNAHQRTSPSGNQPAGRKASKPTTRGASATKFDIALMS